MKKTIYSNGTSAVEREERAAAAEAAALLPLGEILAKLSESGVTVSHQKHALGHVLFFLGDGAEAAVAKIYALLYETPPA